MNSFKDNKHLSMQKTIGFLFLIFTLFLVAGCSANGTAESNEAEKTADKSEQSIRTVIEKEFNGPDEKYKELFDAAMDAQISEKYSDDYGAYLKSPENQALMNYTEETYADYFTENGYENFVNQAPAFMYSTLDGEYQLDTSAIEITQNKNESTLYNFTFTVDYTDGNGESDQFNFEGKAMAPEEGKIGTMEYVDKDGLFQKLSDNA